MTKPKYTFEDWKEYIEASRKRVERIERDVQNNPARALSEASAEMAELPKAVRLASKSMR